MKTFRSTMTAEGTGPVRVTKTETQMMFEAWMPVGRPKRPTSYGYYRVGHLSHVDPIISTFVMPWAKWEITETPGGGYDLTYEAVAKP